MASVLVLFVIAGAFVSLCSAHLCTIYPLQRGPTDNIDSPGSQSCFLVKGPCGGFDQPGANPTVFSGKIFLAIEKNLNHWNSADPGNFEVSLINGNTTTQILQFSDTDETAPFVYYMMAGVPENFPKGAATLQVIYNTNNPNAPAQFFQCSDVQLK
eukprot:CAMPEP_0177652112 /NCGR_PEP_ID=MMETSP0447-20121125/12930_1 /TAXON_ID=0 /ORGANISM="Stygamoeba regulata, Strain BSH-02190019" /LENGTH=155 /DNA_ID=CAMNT_0019155283 /DNA_START=43 /DNA_END=510 /DNA_ORIENTATION=+